MTVFSLYYKTYKNWLFDRPRTSVYAKRIKRLHRKYPLASLKELRTGDIKTWDKLPFSKLTSKQIVERNKALEIKRSMLSGEPLTKASKRIGLSMNKTKSHLASVLRLIKGKWVVQKKDSIERSMRLFSDATIKEVTITNFYDASLIGEFMSDVRYFLNDGKPERLNKYSQLYLVDSKGVTHFFEINPNRLYELNEMMENPEFFQIYVE